MEQSASEIEPSLTVVEKEQSVQFVDLSKLVNLPLGQSLQIIWSSVNLPVEQALQGLPFDEVFPAGQSIHALDPEKEYLPEAHT